LNTTHHNFKLVSMDVDVSEARVCVRCFLNCLQWRDVWNVFTKRQGNPACDI